MTNFDKIKNMTPMQFEIWLDDIVFNCGSCLACEHSLRRRNKSFGLQYLCPLPVCPFDNDDYRFAKWLESEVDAS